jgi:predicted AlkP superfamily phosphohydrolase/phosphomutase
MSATRVLVIGIDAANPTLLRQWAHDGTLPTLRSMIARGLLGATRGIEGFFVGSTWPSFYTGVTPARHGFHYLTQLKPGTYEFYRPATDAIAHAPFWRHLSRAGRRVAILDVPLTRIDRELNGIHVVEWGGHDAAYGFDAWPAHVAATIRSRFGAHPSGLSCDGGRRTADDYRHFIDGLVRGVGLKTQLTAHFLRESGWDFFLQVFTESHCAGHQCWHLHDVTHPAHEPAVAAVTGDPLRRVYAAIDTAIGELLAAAGDALVVVLAAHGMSHWYGAQFLLRDILLRLGAAHPSEAAPAPRRAASPLAIGGARWAWQHLPESMRRGLRPLRRRLDRGTNRRGVVPTIGVDPRASRCFPQRIGNPVGGIRLNVIGREPDGLLAPGVDADAFADALTADLSGILDERTGKPLVRRVVRTANLYSGDRLGDLPDLLVEWSDEVPTGSTLVANGAGAHVRASSPKIGVVEGVNRYCRTGEHRPDGLFVAVGPRVRPGRASRDVSILDFAPTFMRLFGVKVGDCDGRAVDELLENRSARG